MSQGEQTDARCNIQHFWELFAKNIASEDQFRFQGNCPATPPLSQQFALSGK